MIPGAGTAAGIALGVKIIGGITGYAVGIAWEAESLADLEDEQVNEILSSTANPTLTLHPRKESRAAPTDSTQFLFLIPNRQVRLLPITIKQAFRLADPKKRLIATRIIDWNLREPTAAAPHAQPMSLTDYPPFQRLSPEAPRTPPPAIRRACHMQKPGSCRRQRISYRTIPIRSTQRRGYRISSPSLRM